MKMLKKLIASVLVVSLLSGLLVYAPRPVYADGDSGSAAERYQSFSTTFYNNTAGGYMGRVTKNLSDNAKTVSNIGGNAMAAASIVSNVYTLSQGLSGHTQGQRAAQAIYMSIDLSLAVAGIALTAGGVAVGPAFIAIAALAGIWNAYINSEEGVAMMDFLDGHMKPSNNTNVYKPNIYIYTEDETELSLRFARPDLVTVSIPEYEDGWHALAADGKLLVDGIAYDYLFYEALTDKSLYDYNEAFLIPAAGRAEVFTEILSGYNFNAREIADFIEFWDDMLGDADYLMYPQLTASIDRTMPLSSSVEFAEYFRIWFAFSAYAGGTYTPAAPVFFDRSDTSTLLEWGGFIL